MNNKLIFIKIITIKPCKALFSMIYRLTFLDEEYTKSVIPYEKYWMDSKQNCYNNFHYIYSFPSRLFSQKASLSIFLFFLFCSASFNSGKKEVVFNPFSCVSSALKNYWSMLGLSICLPVVWHAYKALENVLTSWAKISWGIFTKLSFFVCLFFPHTHP